MRPDLKSSSVSSSLSSLGEFGLIGRIAASVKPGTGVITGIGDDSAVTGLTPGMQLLTSTDMLLEDVHFRRSWHYPYRLGRKSLAVNISDIAAMGGIPRWATLSFAVPGDLPLDFLEEFIRGFLSVAEEFQVSLIGGDTCSSKGGFAVSVTIMGEQEAAKIIRRSGARPGDEIWVSGTLGDAAMGLNLLEGKFRIHEGTVLGEGAEAFLQSRLLDPLPRVSAGVALADSGLVTAMIDISDGLLGDLGHICRLSGTGAEILLDRLPMSGPFRYLGDPCEEFPWHLALSGGEDYELCFTASPGSCGLIHDLMKNAGITLTPVGIVTDSMEVVVMSPDGTRYCTDSKPFNHFA